MQAKVPGDPGSHQQIVPYRPPEVVWSFSAVCSWPPRWGTTDSHCPGLSGGLSEALMQKLPHSVHQEQPDTVWAVRKSCQIQQPLKIRMVKQNNIIPGETQILLRFTGWESNVNAKKQPPVGIKCEPMDQENEQTCGHETDGHRIGSEVVSTVTQECLI
ncbi:uncharacterized protein LOC144331760 isoform X2 [Macaca mulatta]